MTPQWRDRINLFSYAVKRRHIPKLRALGPVVYFPMGWALITWSAFGWNKRAWAASVGAYVLLDTLIDVLGEFIKSKRLALSRDK